MCSCGRYENPMFYKGIYRGVYEVHSQSFCTRKDVNTWRTRLFVPIADWFDRLAGSYRLSSIEDEIRNETELFKARRKSEGERKEALRAAVVAKR